ASQAKSSGLLSSAELVTIPHVIDTESFYPDPECDSFKRELSPEGLPIVLFPANPGQTRKGYADLIAAIEMMPKNSVRLVSVGRSGGQWQPPVSQPHMHIEFIDDHERLVKLFGAADVCVVPTMQESFGQVCIEAMACGTPVVGYDCGVMPDVIVDRLNGRLVERGNVEQLAESISWVVRQPLERLSKAARSHIVNGQFTREQVVTRHLSLYQSLISP
ncbi:glycosyltransferase, partial [Gammaproteobacteria bacterium]|nr:glycosyltransferase [Gammaproteobacteria bacterium]